MAASATATEDAKETKKVRNNFIMAAIFIITFPIVLVTADKDFIYEYPS